MPNIATLPAVALIVGAAPGVYAPLPLAAFVGCAAIGWLALTIALMAPRVLAVVAATPESGTRRGVALWIPHLASVASAVGFFGAGAAPLLGTAARVDSLKHLLSGRHAQGFTSPRCRGEGRVRGSGADSCTVRRT